MKLYRIFEYNLLNLDFMYLLFFMIYLLFVDFIDWYSRNYLSNKHNMQFFSIKLHSPDKVFHFTDKQYAISIMNLHFHKKYRNITFCYIIWKKRIQLNKIGIAYYSIENDLHYLNHLWYFCFCFRLFDNIIHFYAILFSNSFLFQLIKMFYISSLKGFLSFLRKTC